MEGREYRMRVRDGNRSQEKWCEKEGRECEARHARRGRRDGRWGCAMRPDTEKSWGWGKEDSVPRALWE